MVKYLYGLAALIVLVDQITKLLIRFLDSPIDLGLFTINYVENYGAGFGILQGHRILLILITIAVVAVLTYYINTVKDYGIAIILGGAIGNLIDRIFLGYVIDFIDFGFWPAFNIADSAITIGAALVIWDQFRNKEQKEPTK
ncbi:MAG: signal peptidase II [Candidatus Woesearchaeota archaeon]